MALSLIACEDKRLIKAPKPFIDPLPQDIKGDVGEDPLYEKQWNLAKVSAKESWESFMSSKAVNVMMIGSGVDYNHEDLRANILVNMKELKIKDPSTGTSYNGKDDDGDGMIDNFVGWDFVDNDGLAYDRYGYDTYLAGVVGAVHGNGKGIKGLLRRVSIYPVRYINNNGQSNLPSLVRALQHISDVKPHVVLLNLIGLKFSRYEAVRRVEEKAIENALAETKKLGIPIVVGAGNIHTVFESDMGVRKVFTGFENVFIVTSVDKEDQKPFLANFSYQFVHTTAPGDKVLTTAPGNMYKEVSSTHVAAAHVAAAIAYAISEYGSEKTYEDYFAALQSTKGSRDISHLARYVSGGNCLDLHKFLSALK